MVRLQQAWTMPVAGGGAGGGEEAMIERQDGEIDFHLSSVKIRNNAILLYVSRFA